MKICDGLPLWISAPNRSGPPKPPTIVPGAEKNAIAIARVSIGKISETVRYAALAPAEAKKKMTHHATVWVVAFSVPDRNSRPVMISRIPDRVYVPAIIGLRPTESKNRPSSSGPQKLPTANGSRYRPTLPDETP